MGQSLARLHVHLVFSTKHRAPLIIDDVRESLHAYMATVLKSIDCMPVLINTVEDHVHALFDLSRKIAVSDVVEEVKTSSSKWLKTQSPKLRRFSWQNGYGAFAVSMSKLETVRTYIANQREHHRRKGFQDEFRQFLKRHEIECDERYVWD